MKVNIIEEIAEAIKNGDEEYLINHKQDIIENIRNFNIEISKLPESLRGDIDIMTAAIIDGNVYEMQDLAYVYSLATDVLKANPEFQKIVKEFETFLREEARKLKEEREKANAQVLENYYKRVREGKEKYRRGMGRENATKEVDNGLER